MLAAFIRFHQVVSKANWSKPQDIILTFNHADNVTCKKTRRPRIVFNIGQNKYRLITGFYFAPNQTILYVRFVGLHKENETIDVCTVDMFKKLKS